MNTKILYAGAYVFDLCDEKCFNDTEVLNFHNNSKQKHLIQIGIFFFKIGPAFKHALLNY